MADVAKPMPGRATLDLVGEILVVDDEADVRELLAEYFRNRGVRVATAEDGQTAVTLLAQEPSRFGLVVTDLQLPGRDGLEVLRAARHLNPSCAVVIVTGYASIDSAIEAVRLGAYDYLTKPFSVGQIEVMLRRVQDRRALEVENRRLLREAARREGAEGGRGWLARLEAVEARLARVETALDTLRDRRGLPPVLR